MEPKQKSSISYAEFIGLCVAFVASALLFWKTTDVRLSALELRMTMKEKSDDMINAKLDKLQEGMNDIKVSLVSKADKK